jgi:hypothetical protein
MISYARAVYAKLWGEATPEQRRISVQLARNSFYFTTAIYVIRNYGEAIAI